MLADDPPFRRNIGGRFLASLNREGEQEFEGFLRKLSPTNIDSLASWGWDSDWLTLHDYKHQEENTLFPKKPADQQQNLQDPILTPLMPKPYGYSEPPEPTNWRGKKPFFAREVFSVFQEELRSASYGESEDYVKIGLDLPHCQIGKENIEDYLAKYKVHVKWVKKTLINRVKTLSFSPSW